MPPLESGDCLGSPPRMWGRPARGENHDWMYRFTPTHVGTTPSTARACRCRTVHPHACGDDSRLQTPSRLAYGSPPRMWGRLLQEDQIEHPLRFTPTHVGTTSHAISPTKQTTVHPHACGDDLVDVQGASGVSGSPPRMWGRLGRSDPQSVAVRFTPTHVGTTGMLIRLADTTSVHPHACGDDEDRLEDEADLFRFTPTHVGTT